MRIKRRYNGRIENEMNGGIQYNFGGLVPEFYPEIMPPCPEQFQIVSTDQPNFSTGDYNRTYTYTGGTFQYGWLRDGIGAFTGTAPDGKNYPVYLHSTSTDMYFRVFSFAGTTDLGWGQANITGNPWLVPFSSISGQVVPYFFAGFVVSNVVYPAVGFEQISNPFGVDYFHIIADSPICPTPTPNITPTISLTPSITPTISLTPSITKSPTPTPSITKSQTPTPSITPTITKTPTLTPTKTPTQSLSVFSYLGRTTPDQNSGAQACFNYLTIRSYFSNKTLASLTIGDYLYDSYPATPTNGGNDWVALKVGGVGQGYAFRVATDGEILNTYTC